MKDIDRVHETTLVEPCYEMTPPHPPREETAEYKRAHDFLVHVQDSACRVCGVRQSTLHDTTANPYGATQIETHHYPIERSLVDACDPLKVHKAFPQVIDKASLMAFIDSPANLIVLCDVCHRSAERGIHHLLVQDWAILPFLLTGYQIVATDKDVEQAEQRDAAIEQGETHG